MRQESKGQRAIKPPGGESRVFQEQRDGGKEGSWKFHMLWLNFRCVQVLGSRARHQTKLCPGEQERAMTWPHPRLLEMEQKVKISLKLGKIS